MEPLSAFLLFMQTIMIPGLVYGSQLALGALGITLIYSILRFATFAHSESMAFAAASSVLTIQFFSFVGLPPLAALLIGLPIVFSITIGMLLGINFFIFRYYQRSRSVAVIFTVVSVGVMFITNSLVRFLVGPREQTLISRADKALYWPSGDGEWLKLSVRNIKKLFDLNEAFTLTLPQLATLVVAIIAVISLFYFLNNTRSGKAMRAFSDNEDLAQLSGINPQRVIQITWIVAGALTVLAGVLYGMDKGFKPFTYILLLLPLFAAAVVGGIGNPIGAIVGGFVIAFAELVITYNYKKMFNYLLPEAWEFSGNVQIMMTENKFAVTFAVLVLVLIVRPTGIFKGKVL
ncbi:MAG: branched-chain amino acid ABC transporter permease [Alphaproteobacteria bacterium]